MTIRLMMVMTMLYQTIITIIAIMIIIKILGGSCPLKTNLMKETRIENNHEIVKNALKYHVSSQLPIEKNCS